MASGMIDAKDSRWYLTIDQLQNSPSRKSGIDADWELSHRLKAAYLIQYMGQELRVSQLCINTAIVYMYRFYTCHSFDHFHRDKIATASLFLAAKVEEQARELESVIRVANLCTVEILDSSKKSYQKQAQDLLSNENILLQTLGFDVTIDHPNWHIIKTCERVNACKDIAEASYILASHSLHLTTMCLQYRPTVVACFCIFLACKWANWEIPKSSEGQPWFYYLDKTVNLNLLEQLTREFLVIYEKSPERLKTKLNSCKELLFKKSAEQQQQRSMSQPSASSSFHPNHTANYHHQQIPHAVQSENIPSNQTHQTTAATSTSSAFSSLRPQQTRTDRPLILPEPYSSAPQRATGSTRRVMPLFINIGNITRSSRNLQATAQQQRSYQSSHDANQQHVNENGNMNQMQQEEQTMKSDQRQFIKEEPLEQQPKSFDPMRNTDMSPPKQKIKVPSIFSPEWNDNANVSPQKSNAKNGFNMKLNRDVSKKDKRYDQITASVSNNLSVHLDKSGNSAKRDAFGQPRLNGASTIYKWLLPEDMTTHENGIDFREVKRCKLDNYPIIPITDVVYDIPL